MKVYIYILNNIETIKILFRIRILSRIGFYDKILLNENLNEIWKLRIKEVLLCPDNKFIQRVENAGVLKNGIQIMHNGIKICAGGYYGSGISQMLKVNKGVHEPQEEFAFDIILKTLPENAKMLELGAYWSFYSLWFKKKCIFGKNYMIEPNKMNIEYGKMNFMLNNEKGYFLKSFISNKTEVINGNNFICIDDFMEIKNIDFLHVLHSDIQGYELKMLQGAKKTLESQKIAYIFISTHGIKIHEECLTFLQTINYGILCEANANKSYSYDGLIVAKAANYEGINKIEISKNTYNLYEKIF